MSKFMRRHPGGSVIRFMVGTDGTQAYEAFHYRSNRAQKLLQTLPQRTATAEDFQNFAVNDSKEVLKDFQELNDDLKKEGWYEPDYFMIFYRCLEIFFLTGVGCCILCKFWDTNKYFALLGLFISSISMGRAGWLMHEGGHGSLTGTLWIDWMIQELFYGLFCGMSAKWWRSQHNKHHATPQKLGNDPDLDTLPLVAFCEEIGANAKNPLMKAWLSVQSIMFLPVTCLLVVFGWVFYLHPRLIIKRKLYREAFWITLRHLIIAIMAKKYFGGFAMGFALYCLHGWIGAAYIFVNFAVSHTHLERVSKDEHRNWVAYSAFHTVNCSHTWWCNWWMSYLNFQIEHHLFPAMPQYRFPKLAPRIRTFFKKHNYPYLYTDYFTALKMTFGNLHTVSEMFTP